MNHVKETDSMHVELYRFTVVIKYKLSSTFLPPWVRYSDSNCLLFIYLFIHLFIHYHERLLSFSRRNNFLKAPPLVDFAITRTQLTISELFVSNKQTNKQTTKTKTLDFSRFYLNMKRQETNSELFSNSLATQLGVEAVIAQWRHGFPEAFDQ